MTFGIDLAFYSLHYFSSTPFSSITTPMLSCSRGAEQNLTMSNWGRAQSSRRTPPHRCSTFLVVCPLPKRLCASSELLYYTTISMPNVSHTCAHSERAWVSMSIELRIFPWGKVVQPKGWQHTSVVRPRKRAIGSKVGHSGAKPMDQVRGNPWPCRPFRAQHGQVEEMGRAFRTGFGGWGGQGCMRREGTPEAAPQAVRQAVGGGCQSGWGRLLSVTNATEAGTCREGDSGWA